MSTGRTILFAAVLTWSGSTSSIVAQSDSQALVPVDQTVSDLDLRAGSLRYVEQGIGVYGQSGSLYRRTSLDPWSTGSGQPLTQQYVFRQPGVTAWIDRPDYLVQDELGELHLNTSPSQDRQFLGLIPPNTVFDLTPPTAGGLNFYAPQRRDGWRDTRINTRINTRIDGIINTRRSTKISGQIVGPSSGSFPPPPKAYKLPNPRLDTSDQSPPQEQPSDEPHTDETVPRDETP